MVILFSRISRSLFHEYCSSGPRSVCIVVRSSQRTVDKAFLGLFVCPDVQKGLVENERFRRLLESISPQVQIPTYKTPQSRIWTAFHQTIEQVKTNVRDVEHTVLMFDGCATYNNGSVLGFTVSTLDRNLVFRTSCISNFKLMRRHAANQVSEIILRTVQSRLGKRTPDYFVSDSAPVNPAAVRSFMECTGDDYWFPCAVHFCQLAMREAVTEHLTGTITSEIRREDEDIEYCDEEDAEEYVQLASNIGTFERITATCRTIRTAINRSHKYARLFEDVQTSCNVTKKIASDVRTRFDSKLIMFLSVLKNRSVLMPMQEKGRRDNSTWPVKFHLSVDDFELVQNVVTVLEPIRNVTSALSYETAWAGDALPLLTSVVGAIRRLQVTTDAETEEFTGKCFNNTNQYAAQYGQESSFRRR